MNDTERRLTESLHRAADGYDGHAAHQIGLDQVVREARSIRRRRTTAVVLASAAAVAVIAPAAVLAGNRLGGRGTGPIDQPTVTPSTSVSPTPAPTPSDSPTPSSPTATATTALRLSAIVRGPDPRIAYVLDHTVHNGGSTSQLPASVGRVAEFTPYHGGWLVADDNTAKGVQLDSTGKVVRQVGTGYRVSADGAETAFPCCNGTVKVGTAMADSETSYTIANPGSIVGFLSGGRVLYDSGAGQGSVFVLGQSSTTFKTLWGAVDANESTDLVAAYLNPKGVSEVFDARTGRTSWSTDQWRLLRFSPDGAYVSATPSAGNGDPTEVAILDAADGHVVTRLRLTDRGLALQYEPVWESDDALMFGTEQSGTHQQAIVRLGADGSVQRASDVIPTRKDGQTWVFTTRP